MIQEGGGGGEIKNSNIQHVTVEPPYMRLSNECELSDGRIVEVIGISGNAL
jgi:hypothetical protein